MDKIEILHSIGISYRRMSKDTGLSYNSLRGKYISQTKSTKKRIDDYFISIIKKMSEGL